MIRILTALVVFAFLGIGSNLYCQSQEIDFEVIEKLVCEQLELDSVSPYLLPNQYGYPFYLEGDFLGDGVKDVVLLLRVPTSQVKLVLVDYTQSDTLVSYVYSEIEDYGFTGVFKKTAPEEALWSNWDDSEEDLGWLTIEEVPIEEQVFLGYNAILVHLGEACGGGFIFWNNDKWNWLQQE